MLTSDTLGAHIRSVRESKGYSQEYMAEMLHISQSSYACLESGKTSLRVERLFQIMDVLELQPEWLFTSIHITSKENDQGKLEYSTQQPVSSEMKTVYEQWIAELRSEIEFLRSIVRK
jgi:transcriptional regulator with XRE-family HTH domain